MNNNFLNFFIIRKIKIETKYIYLLKLLLLLLLLFCINYINY